MNQLLEIGHVTKTFPGVKALDDVSLSIQKGEIHTLMGENGAGKSTLMKILIGMYTPDSGDIFLKGEKVRFPNISTALNLGISMIHQELSAVPNMSAAENIWLGREFRTHLGLIDHRAMIENTHRLFKKLDIMIDPTTKMEHLSVASKQMVEIAKAISYDAELIIMDEPTSAITEKEVAHLFSIIDDLKKKGIAIIYITHKMDEVFHISDTISVLRDGQMIATKPASELDKEALIKMMVGREMNNLYPQRKNKKGDIILEVKNLTDGDRFSKVSFSLRSGEILGIAGLIGAGRTEVVETIFGIRPRIAGSVTLHGAPFPSSSPGYAISRKMALLTEDRKLNGLYQPLSVLENMEIVCLPAYIKNGLINHKKIRISCNGQIHKLRVKTPSLQQVIRNLSGGNQQKVLISRWLLTEPEILIVDEPTRGIDVGAKAEIHKLMSQLVEEGKAMIMISSELPEILGMSDRVMVMHEGEVTGILEKEEMNQENILKLASGESL